MSVNKFQPHVYVIPEDRADEQIANGFLLHDQVKPRQIQVLPCGDGWSGVLDKFETEYILYLRKYKDGNVILLIDFDAKFESRRKRFDDAVPVDLKDRVFVIGARETPEILKQELKLNLEDIGIALADDCYKGTTQVWDHDELKQNENDRLRLIQSVKPILFSR